MSFNIRFDFNNIFNRLVYGNPSSTNAQSTQRTASDGMTRSGFGAIDTTSSRASVSPRTGLLVFRFRF